MKPEIKFRVEHTPKVLESIAKGRDTYTKHVERVHGTSNKEVYRVYDQITKELVGTILRELMGTLDADLDKYCEKVIYDEF